MTRRTKSPATPSFRRHPLVAAIAACLRQPGRHLAAATGLALVLGCPVAALAATYIVTNTDDGGSGSLRQAVLDANANPGADEIVFAATVSETIALSSGPIDVSDSVTVSGPGQANLTIDGGEIEAIFTMGPLLPQSGALLTISRLTLTNANYAINVIGADGADPRVAIIDSIITGNILCGVVVDAAYKSKAELDVGSSVVSGNGNCGIAIFGSYNGSDIGKAVIANSVITGNAGAAIYTYAADVSIVGGTISDNGVGIMVRSENSDRVTVADTLITENAGNGITMGGGSLTVERSAISGNDGSGIELDFSYRVTIRVDSSTISGNGEGGILNYSALDLDSAEILNTTISENRGGAGIWFGYVSGTEGGIRHSTIISNEEGGIFAASVPERFNLKLADSIVSGNGRSPDLLTDQDSDFRVAFNTDYSLIQDPGDVGIVETVPGSNLIGLAPLMGPLQDNGGPTLTHALLPGSPTIDRGDPAFLPPPDYDQRGAGFPRVVNGRIDMGAFEVQDGEPPVEPSGSAWLKSLGDTNGDGTPEIAVVARTDGRNLAAVRDAANGTLVSQFEFSAELKAVDVEVMNDFMYSYGLGPNLVLLGDGPPTAETRNALGGELLGSVAFNLGFRPMDLTVLPDEDGNGVPELGTLGQGSTRVEILDAVTGEPVNNLWFAPSFEPRQVIALPDLNGNGSAEVGVVLSKADEPDRVAIKDMRTGERVGTLMAWQPQQRFALLQALPVPDADGNPTGKVALLLREPATGKTLVRVTDATSNAQLAMVRGYSPDFEPVKLAAVSDLNGNGAEEYALLARNPDTGQVQAKVHDGASSELISTLWFSKDCIPLDMASISDINANGAEELIMLGRCGTEDQLKAVVKDARTAETLNRLDF